MRGMAVGVVKASKSAAFPVGSYASASVGWTELAIVHEKSLQRTEVPKNGKVTDVLGVLGKNVPHHVLTDYIGYAKPVIRTHWPDRIFWPS